MQSTSLNIRHLNSILVLVMILGTAALAILALAGIIFAVVLLHTALDAIIELVQTVVSLYTHGDALTHLLILVFILFVAWKAAPRLVRFVRREIAAAPFLFMSEEAVRPQSASAPHSQQHRAPSQQARPQFDPDDGVDQAQDASMQEQDEEEDEVDHQGGQSTSVHGTPVPETTGDTTSVGKGRRVHQGNADQRTGTKGNDSSSRASSSLYRGSATRVRHRRRAVPV